MLKSYFIVSWRNLLRNKTFSLINITGLAVGMSVVFLIYQYIQAELSYDKFHKDAGQIYRIPIAYSGSFESEHSSATNHPAVGPALKAEFPEIQDFARLVRASMFLSAATVAYEESPGHAIAFNEERIFIADESFLKIFSFPMLEGDATTALKESKTAVITDRMAKKYFGNSSPLGKILSLNQLGFKITGVLKDIPENSHLQFDMLLSFSTLGEKWGYDQWTWPEFYNYVQLKPGTDPKALAAKFPAFMAKYLGKVWEELKFKSSISLQPITDIHLKSNLGLEQSTNGSQRTVYFLTLLGIFILVIAWINYINLSTAKSLERSKEVGLRKVSGASKGQLITQFFFDACMVNFLAFILAIALLSLSIPFFESLTGKNISSILISSGAWYSLSFWAWVVITLFFGILVVGLYPALLLSSFNPAQVLKGKFSKSSSGIFLRKGLVVFQYVLSIFLIAGTITISQQLRFMQNQDLGYDKDQMLIVRAAAIFDSTYSNQISFFKHQLQQVPAVSKITSSGEIPGHAITDRNSILRINADEKDNQITYFIGMDDEFISTYGMSLVAGRNLTDKDRFIYNNRGEAKLFFNTQNRILVNEDLAQKLGFIKPEDALNQMVKFKTGPGYYAAEIVGVVKNHHQESLREKYEPEVYVYPEYDAWRYFSIRVNTSNIQGTIAKINAAYSASFPNNAFEYFFLDEHFNKQYQGDLQFANIFGVFTILAIIIACLGLFGLGMFSVTQRIKEIGIRKVLGASAPTILILFSKDSVRLVLLSYLIALPLIYLAAQSWLGNFAFHIGMEWQMFLIPPLFLLAISVATITFICLRAALMSPAISLRSE